MAERRRRKDFRHRLRLYHRDDKLFEPPCVRLGILVQLPEPRGEFMGPQVRFECQHDGSDAAGMGGRKGRP